MGTKQRDGVRKETRDKCLELCKKKGKRSGGFRRSPASSVSAERKGIERNGTEWEGREEKETSEV